MSKRQRLPLLFVSAIFVAAVTCYFLLAPRHPVSWYGYNRIELGMTEAEVEKVVGLPPGWYEPMPEGEYQVLVHEQAASRGRTSGKGYSWVSSRGHLDVNFDDHGKVVGVSFTPTRHVPSFFERIRRWFSF